MSNAACINRPYHSLVFDPNYYDNAVSNNFDDECMLYWILRLVSLLSDDPGSYCFGSIRGGIYDGQIMTQEGTYYLERAHKHFSKDLLMRLREKHGHAANSEVHSVIYHEKHVQYPFTNHRNGELYPSFLNRSAIHDC